MKKILFIVLFIFFGSKGIAQHSIQPFLFTLNTLTGDKAYWNVHYSGSYGERTTGQFGYDGLGQQLGVKRRAALNLWLVLQ